eukprot:GABV01000057.1.p1 GENE.GABV01000057.1~~GABV01000057.1.p1  ORF type:complete len:338 (+),score=139.86 GABV01000057.1:1271-2284(+)
MATTVQEKLAAAEAELALIPPLPAPEHARQELLTLITEFSHDVHDRVEPQRGSSDKMFWQQIDGVFSDFRHKIDATRPKFAFGDAKVEENPSIFTFQRIRALIQNSFGRQLKLPFQISYQAVTAILDGAVRSWEAPARETIRICRETLNETVSSLCLDRFSRFSALCERVNAEIDGVLVDLAKEAMDEQRALLAREKRFFTTSNDRMASLRKDFLDSLMAQFAKEKNKMTASAASEVEESLNVMASALAYFVVAQDRFVDAVCMAIDDLLLIRFAATLRARLVGNLEILTAKQAHIEKLLSEDPGVADRRRALRGQISRLRETKAKIAAFVRQSLEH